MEEMGDEPSGITVDVGNVGQELVCSGLGWAISKIDWALGTEGIEFYQFLFENLAVKEQQRVERRF